MTIRTNQKLIFILKALTRKLEEVNALAWSISKDPKDTCGAIDMSAISDYSDEGLIKEIEIRANQIEERKRYIAGLHGGADGHCRAANSQADELYQKYCGKC